MLAQHLTHIEFLEGQIADFDQQIATFMAAEGSCPSPPPPAAPSDLSQVSSEETPAADGGVSAVPWEEAVELLDSVPGIGRTLAEQLLAEVGTDMQRFGSAAHLASWAKVCPGNHESAGKRYSGKTGTGNRWLRSGLVQAAHAAVKVKESHLAAVYRRLVGRRGVKKAISAVAHRIVTAVYFMLLNHEPYREPGAVPVDEQRKARLLTHMLKRLEKLGYQAHLEPPSTPAS
jgi:transposase